MTQPDAKPTALPRFPRAKFTRVLTAMCERLDAMSTVEFDYDESKQVRYWGSPVAGRAQAKLMTLWAVGSWSRGSSHCGDLDLLAEIECKWLGIPTLGGKPRATAHPPPFRVTRRLLLGSPGRVEFHDAVDVKSQRVAIPFEEAVLIWAPGMDWRSAIAAIKENPASGRAARYTDGLPFDIKFTSMDLREAEFAVRAKEKGLLSWEFIPFDSVALSPPAVYSSREERALSQLGSQRVKTEHAWAAYQATTALRKELPLKNLTYWFGDCGIWAGMFGDDNVKAIVITPKMTKHGPGGLLVVRRGPNFSVAAAKQLDDARHHELRAQDS